MADHCPTPTKTAHPTEGAAWNEIRTSPVREGLLPHRCSGHWHVAPYSVAMAKRGCG